LDKPERVFTPPIEKGTYRDFSTILSSFHSIERSGQLVSKKMLVVIMESRNGIVHKGKFNEWDDEIARYIVECAFFIQHVSFKNLGEGLLPDQHIPRHNLANNQCWRKGAEGIAKKLCIDDDRRPIECPHCAATALVSNELFAFNDATSAQDLQCLACLMTIDLTSAGRLISCELCKKETYYVDTLNEQTGQLYCGKCLNCGGSLDIRKCAGCEQFYAPDLTDEQTCKDGKYFCSKDCDPNH
jgi:hypothetical protein